MDNTWTRLQLKKGVIKDLPQSGRFVDIKRDKGRKALPPGVRISKTGKKYTETRRNRTDIRQGVL